MKPLPRVVCLLYLLLGEFTDASARDWPGWGGPDGNFAVNNAGVLHPDQSYALEVVWRKPLGTGYSGIAVRDGLAVALFSDGASDYVIGLDAGDGTQRWKHRIGPTFLGRYGSQSGPLSTPLLADGKVFALSPQGSLFALDAVTGQRVWAVDIVAEHQALAPYWGFTSSPRKYGDLLFVQTGGPNGKAISAFDLNGKAVWSAVNDTVAYQSPGLFKLGDRDHLVFHGNHYLLGLVPQTGEVLWEFAHGGQNGASAASGHPVEVGQGRYFVKNRGDGGLLFGVSAIDGTYTVEEVWKTRHIRGTYLYTVYHDGFLYGYNGRILTCIDVETGERVWRSREPGDGLPIVVDGHLVICTKDGKLAIAQATGEVYKESARLDLFDDIVWSPVSFANGRFYARSMAEIACVGIVPGKAADAEIAVAGMVPDSRFADFVEKVERTADKSPLIDRFMAEQEVFPVIEGDSLVHFVYRGTAADVALAGDLVGWRFDQPLHRIDGTDLFYYSSFYATFKRPDVFGKLAMQSIDWDQTAAAENEELIAPAAVQLPLRIYLDWGRYDLRSPTEGYNLVKSSEAFARLLEERGYSFAGGRVNDGAGWASWRNRTDRVFEALFPLAE